MVKKSSMLGKCTNIIDETVNEFFDALESCHSIEDKYKLYHDLMRKVIKCNMGLIHCLWNEHFIKESVLKSILEDDDLIDNFCESELSNKKDTLVKRFKKIKQTFTKGIVSETVQSHLIEATYCYLYGFDQAAIALCRATLDFALKAQLHKRDNDRTQLADLIKEALKKGYLPASHRTVAHNIRNRGNEVMHEGPFRFDPLKIINDTREVLEVLYKPRQA
ncbi:MAG: DUF4145 domain-containing protein [Desulfovibrionales bacterium]|nr:DUF4145 domain-containing protein [Desulfovibrionales bacterium]